MRAPAVCAFALFASTLFGQTEVGQGAPNEHIRILFTTAYFRGNFARIAGDPTGPVRRFGTTGLLQEFNDATRPGGRLALVKASSLSDPDDPYGDVYQVTTDMYAYYSTAGSGTAGYPIHDTRDCRGTPCVYQAFDKKIVLFSYQSNTVEPKDITLRDPFYTRWEALTGISGLGPPTSAEQNIASSFGGASTAQTFQNGALFNITSGALTGRFVSVRQPVWSLYQTLKAHTGSLGYPTGEEIVLPNGRRRQSFEGGAIEYDAASGPVLRLPVQSISVRPSDTPLRLNLGQTVTLQARLTGQDGSELNDRPVVFSTSNSRVVSVQSSGLNAMISAVGGGSANITATSEGKVSPAIQVIVAAPCCGIGEGAPTPAIQQAIQDAVTRNRLSLQLPGPERVRRAGAGYQQEFSGTNGSRYVIAVSDKTGQAYALTGALLARYESLGGAASILGYPASDATASGRQMFDGGALAGSPARIVSGAILQKWALLGFESGSTGAPASEASAVLSFTGISGTAQAFERGVILSSPRGSFAVSGLILLKYSALGAGNGSLGVPIGDEAARRQEFEGGTVEYAAGDSEARAILKDRKPAVSALPGAVLPGGSIRLTVSGFAEGGTIRISATGQTDFVVRTANGAYAWDALIPAQASPATIRIKAVDAADPAIVAEGEYRIRSSAEVRARLEIAAGDTQTGAPGSVVPGPLRILLKDEQGAALSGVTVRFSASPGAQVTPAIAVTDAGGFAEARLRLPAAQGIALVTAESLRQVVTFSARSQAVSLSQFPQQSRVEGEPALLAAAASIVRYHQNRGALPAPSGLADPASLDRFLTGYCHTDAQGSQSCDGVLTDGAARAINLWRLAAFAGGALDVSLAAPDPQIVRESLSEGNPALLIVAGGRALVAIGVTEAGAILVHDPVPGSGKRTLEEYTNGAVLSGVVLFAPHAPPAGGFAVASWRSSLTLTSPAGECGRTLDLQIGPALLRQRYCPGSEAAYQLDLAGSPAVRATVTDLAEGGARVDVAAGSSASFRISRQGSRLSVAPQQTSLSANGVVNSASFSSEIAPGSIIAIFGSGFSKDASVQVGGRTIPVLGTSPFQINAVIPADVAPGDYALKVKTSFGEAEQRVLVRPLAPAIFRVGDSVWAVVNPDGTLNAPAQPGRRGQSLVIYATGLGPLVSRGGLEVTSEPVRVTLRGEEIPVLFAGRAPGYDGLYQINVAIPPLFAAGLAHPLVVGAAGVESSPANVAIQ